MTEPVSAHTNNDIIVKAEQLTQDTGKEKKLGFERLVALSWWPRERGRREGEGEEKEGREKLFKLFDNHVADSLTM